jgi:hypothetical protein
MSTSFFGPWTASCVVACFQTARCRYAAVKTLTRSFRFDAEYLPTTFPTCVACSCCPWAPCWAFGDPLLSQARSDAERWGWLHDILASTRRELEPHVVCCLLQSFPPHERARVVFLILTLTPGVMPSGLPDVLLMFANEDERLAVLRALVSRSN